MRTLTTIVFIHRHDGWVPAGRLTMVEDGRNSHAVFDYGTRYVRRADRVSLDPTALPLPIEGMRPAPFRTEPGFALFNGLRDAAPDGWGRYLMDKAAGAQALEEYDYLLASGDNRIGALAFGVPGENRPRRQAPWGDQEAAGERIDLAALAEAAAQVYDIDRLEPGLRRLLEAGSSLGGARPKAATEIDGRPWIAKFPAKDDLYSVSRVEYATMSLAATCGLNVPPIQLTRIFERDIYLIERFDRTPVSPLRLPFASGLTLLGAHESESTRYAYSDLAEALRLHGSQPRVDMAELFRRMVFNILVLNDDDHLRNHGFIHDGVGWRLSPLYDVVPKPQVGLDRRLVLGVGVEGRTATLDNALSNAAAFGLSTEEAGAIIETLRATVNETWRTAFTAAGLGPDLQARFATCFRQALPVAQRDAIA